MDALRVILWKLRGLRPGHRRAMEEEMRAELESLAALAQADGSRAELGSLAFAAEEGRSVWMWNWLEQFAADVRYACRAIRRNPGLTTTAVLSLALGIGANTAIFSLMNAMLLKTLPANDPARLAVLTSYSKDGRVGDFGYADYLAIRDGRGPFSGVMAASTASAAVAGIGGESEPVQRKIVSGNYFSVLQVQPAVGRAFRGDEEEQQAAVIGDRWWRQAFGGSRDAIGRQIDLDGKSFTVVGVAPPEFLSETLGESVDVWATMAAMPAVQRSSPGFTWLNLMGRLQPGVSLKQASGGLRGVVPQLQNQFIERIEVLPGGSGSSGLRDTFSAPLKVLMGVVAVVLLLACANLAGLLVARAASRQREIATRLAIGASRVRLFRQLLTESVVLAVFGGLLGLGLSLWGQQLLLNLISGAGKTISVDLRPDLPVLLFNAAISILTGLLFGVAPALHAVRRSVGDSLKTGSGAAFGKGGLGLRGGLVSLQAALSMLLLVVGGLLVHTLQNLKNQDLGYRAANVLSVQLAPQGQETRAWPVLIADLLRRTEAIPGVQSACVSFDGSLGSTSGIRGFRFDGVPASNGEETRARSKSVSPKYFATLGIPLLAGREFSSADTETSVPVAIVNRTMARKYASGDNAVGRHFVFNGKSYEIVGVTKDARHGDLRQATPPFVYFAAQQSNSAIHALEVRTAVSPSSVTPDIRRVVREVDPRLRVVAAATLEQLIDQRLSREVLVARLAGFFAGLTLLLVILGVYGTVAYSVARRTKEIGIRMALGARPANITSVVLRRLAIAVIWGLAVGAVGAMVAARLLTFLLFGLKATDAQTLSEAAVILCAAALVAGYLPVRRALRLDPTHALRLE
jgi:putative ABC transport system permease protein